MTIIFNTQNKAVELKILLIEDMESSFMGCHAQPCVNNMNFYYFVGGFAVNIKLEK
ncbi:MAG: hypothetical protein RR478_05490 [Bacilli bacterium]